MTYYDYKELEIKALENPTKENLANLWKWFEQWGTSYWNGECYQVNQHYGLYPVFKITIDDDFEIVDYLLK